MDTSEQNIKMCEKAEKIQGLWFPNASPYMRDLAFTHSDTYYKRDCKGHRSIFQKADKNSSWLEMHGGEIGLMLITHGSRKENFIEIDESYPSQDCIVLWGSSSRLEDERWLPKEDCIWLPGQDQLQEMLDFYPDNPLPPHKLAKALWDYCASTGTPTPFDSMEQLWLAFVMKEKYGKTWDGDKWVKE